MLWIYSTDRIGYVGEGLCAAQYGWGYTIHQHNSKSFWCVLFRNLYPYTMHSKSSKREREKEKGGRWYTLWPKGRSFASYTHRPFRKKKTWTKSCHVSAENTYPNDNLTATSNRWYGICHDLSDRLRWGMSSGLTLGNVALFLDPRLHGPVGWGNRVCACSRNSDIHAFKRKGNPQ